MTSYSSHTSTDSSVEQPQKVLWTSVGAILIFVFIISVMRIFILYDRVAESSDVTADENVLHRAEDAVRSAELVLGFLEGASVLLTVAAGIAVLYGFREIRDIRSKLADQLQAGTKEMKELLDEVRPYREAFQQVPDLTKKLENTIADVSALVQADQEFRLNNYNEAYEFAQKVLQDPDHVGQELEEPIQLALFITGWLEIHHVSGKIDDGLRHLKIALDRQPDWHSVRAAYGVGLRRKAMQLKEQGKLTEFEDMMNQAKGKLYDALGASRKLIDFNHESFWGPVGGILRDTGEFTQAIEAYQQALQVTPGSSYPQGNLASLYLREAKGNPSFDQEILFTAFTRTVEFARAELAIKPNDYFLLMDIAMSSTILGYQDPEHFKVAAEFFELAMNMKNVGNLNLISQRGWKFLLDNCPKSDDWQSVRDELQKKLDAMSA